MAKKMYAVQNGQLRKLRKGYTVIDRTVRKIRKGYTVIAGRIRPFWAGGELEYFGDYIDGVSNGVDGVYLQQGAIAAASIPDYALFAGGFYFYYDPSNTSDSTTKRTNEVSIYDKQLIKLRKSLRNTKQNVAAASAHGHAIFAGGDQWNKNNIVYGDVESFDSSLTRVTLTSLASNVTGAVGGAIGKYALIAGGGYQTNYLSNQVNWYDKDLTKGNCEPLHIAKTGFGSANTTSHLLFAGGMYKDSQFNAYSTDYVDVYNQDLTKTICTLSAKSYIIPGTSIGEFAIFSRIKKLAVDPYHFDVFSDDLTRIELNIPNDFNTAVHSENFAIFAGSSYITENIITFDEDLVKSSPEQPIKYRTATGIYGEKMSGAMAGDFLVLAGGNPSSDHSIKETGQKFNVTVYKT